jgi:tetratricopeptide (TPR) repeat protein
MRARLNIARGLNIKVATDDLASLLGPRKSELTPALLAQAYSARAALKLFNHQPAEAVRDAQEAVRANPKLASAHQVLGLALVQANNVGQALNEFDRARTLDPSVNAFYFEAAKALAQAKEVDKAVTILKKVALKDENYHLAYGDLLARKGDSAGALAEYDEALKQNQFSAPAFYGKGLILVQEKKIPEAGKAFESAFGARPNYAEAHQQMGYLLLDAKKGEDAASELEQALTMYVESGTPRDRLVALRDDFIARLKKGAPKIVSKFEDDCKQILH